VASDYKSIRRT